MTAPKHASQGDAGSTDSTEGSQRQILTALVQVLLFCAIQEGLDPSELLQRAGLTVAEIEPLNQHVPYTKVLALIQEIEAQRPNINLGFMMGRRITTARMGPLGYVLHSATSLAVVLRDFAKFQGFMNGGLLAWNVAVDVGCCVITLTPDPALAEVSWVLEAPITMLVTIARELTGHRVVPLRVSFRNSPRAGIDDHDEFFGVPVEWNAEDNVLVLSDSVLALPVRSANRGLYPHLLLSLDTQQTQAVPPSPVMTRVQSHIQRTLRHGPPLKESVARAIGMSARTMYRRLSEAGTTFEGILERTRRELALEYLADARKSISEVAMLLGYSEPSPFFRAFLRWFGSTPAEYRDRVKRIP